MSPVHMGHPSAALPEVPPGSSRQQGTQETLLCGVDKDDQHYADYGPSVRGPVAPHPHLIQSNPWRSFLSLLLPSAFQGDCLQ